MIVRLRRTRDPVQRHQLRWVAWSAGVIAIVYLGVFVPGILGLDPDSPWAGWLGTFAVMTFMLIPITIGIGVLKYRLYDIDIVIRKTVIYAILAALLLVIGVATVWIASGLFASTFEGGRADLVVGVAVEDNTFTDDGAIHVFYGTPGGLNLAGDTFLTQNSSLVEDVSELCTRMAIIDKGEILLEAEPLRAVQTMERRVWQRVVAKDELPLIERDYNVLSTKLLGGKTVVRVYSETQPSPAFQATQPELHDVYFSVMAGHYGRTAALEVVR